MRSLCSGLITKLTMGCWMKQARRNEREREDPPNQTSQADQRQQKVARVLQTFSQVLCSEHTKKDRERKVCVN